MDLIELEGKPDFKPEDVVYPKREKPVSLSPWREHDLSKVPTRVLLRRLAETRHPSYYDDAFPRIQDLKEELAKRPHVHNKTTGSAARRKLSQQEHGPKKRKTPKPRTKKQKEAAEHRRKYPALYR